ncbi:6077_t:CDS:2, partial [Acaulospora colombiana]
ASRENSSALAPVSLKAQMEEDGLAIWLVTLRNTPQDADAAKQVLFDLLPTAVEFMATNLDLLGTLCQIMESYLLLDYARVLQLQALPLHQAFLQVYQQALSTNIKDMLSAANLIVQLAPSAMWGEAMHNSTFFAKLLDSVIEDKGKQENSLILVEVLHLFARMIMKDPMVFVQLVAASSSTLNQPPAYLMNGFLDQWWAKFDYVVDAPRRKLVALATAQLLSTGNEEVVDRLKSMEPLNIWLDVLGELKEALSQRPEGEEEDSPLIRFWKAQDELNLPDRLEEVTETLEMDRRREVGAFLFLVHHRTKRTIQLFKRDPVRNVPLKEFIQEKMQQAQAAAAANGVDFQKAMSLLSIFDLLPPSSCKNFDHASTSSSTLRSVNPILCGHRYYASRQPSSFSQPEPGQGLQAAANAPVPFFWRLVAVGTTFVAFYYTWRPLDDPKKDPRNPPDLGPHQFTRCTVLSLKPDPPEAGNKADHVVIQMNVPVRFLPEDGSYLANAIHHVYIKDDDMQIERPYTPLNGIGVDGKMDFWIKKYPGGEVSNWLSRLPRHRNIE